MVASVRIQNPEIMVLIEEKSYNVAIFLDVMIVLWSFYAFFMVLGLSEDIIGKNASSKCRETSASYLYVSFFASVVFANTGHLLCLSYSHTLGVRISARVNSLFRNKEVEENKKTAQIQLWTFC